VQPWASCLHICASVTKWCKLAPVSGRWCFVASQEGNRRSGVTLATCQTLVFLHMRAQGLGGGDEYHLSSVVDYGLTYNDQSNIYREGAFFASRCLSAPLSFL